MKVRKAEAEILLLLVVVVVGCICIVQADLPSCTRAKCTHCRVPFIAEMCPGACAVCAGPAGKNLITTVQHGTHDDARAFGTQQVHARVPLAQQVPQEQPPPPLPQRFAPQRFENNGNNNNNNNNFRAGNQHNNFNNNGQSVVYRDRNNNFNSNNNNNQYGPNVPQIQVAQQPQQQQFPTGFGGFYNGPQQNFAQQQPQPLMPEGPGAFANPFQPFLQQSFNSAQQQPQPPFVAQQPQLQQQFPFTVAPPLGPTWFDFSPLTVPTMPPAQFQPQQQQQQYFGPQFPYNQQPQQNANNDNNNNNFGFVQQTQQQQLFNNNNNNQQGQIPQAQFIAPSQGAVQPPVLHAVPNVADPLQRPRQLYSLPTVANEQLDDKQLQHITDGPNPPFIADKGIGVGDEFKQPYHGATSIFQPQNGRTCPKQPNWEPCVPKDIANQRFRNCCANLGDGCSQLCSYDQNLNTIQLAVLTGRCPVSRVADMMVCASGNEDATTCCQAFGVFEPGFEHCRPYCNPKGGLPNDGMLAEKYRCLQKLQQIQKCFYLTQRP